jgi:hypothetical protein
MSRGGAVLNSNSEAVPFSTDDSLASDMEVVVKGIEGSFN